MFSSGDLVLREAMPLPAPTLTERVTAAFYAWEHRGRGWLSWPYPVELEPPFVHPLAAFTPVSTAHVDDARKHTWLSGLIAKLKGEPETTPPTHTRDESFPDAEPEVFPGELWPVTEIELTVPSALKVGPNEAEQLLTSLGACRHPIGFEVAGTSDAIRVQLAAREEDAATVRSQVEAHFPEVVAGQPGRVLEQLWRDGARGTSVIIDFGLAQEFMRPLRTLRSFEPDPLVSVAAALSELDTGEAGVLQVLFRPARAPWAKAVLWAVTDGAGGSFFTDAPEMPKLAREKVSRPLFAAIVRVAARAPEANRAWEIARSLGGALQQFANPPVNELMPLSEEAYDEYEREENLLYRQSRRSGMLLNAGELASLVHLPSASVRTPKLRREIAKTKAAPAAVTGHALVLGENAYRGKTTTVTLSVEQRVRHLHLVGATGTGKSHLLMNLAIQDLEEGRGLAVLDPHGDVIERLMGYVPEERLDDVILLDPADPEWAVGFNPLEAHSALERDLLASDLVSVFERLATSWGDRMTAVLSNAVLAFLGSEKGGTVADLRRFLVEKDFRKRFLKTVADEEVVFFWEKEYPLLSGHPEAPILTRLNTFLRHRLVRHMVAQRKTRLEFARIMDGGKILLAKLAQGQIGRENSYLLGSLLVAKFHQFALARQGVAEAERRPFYLYIDEFHNFATPSMAAILAGARKYRLGLILAHQDLEQLKRRDPELLSAVLTNPATRVCFRVGDMDAKKLADGFSAFDAEDLQKLGIGEAVIRVERADWDFNLRTRPLPPLKAETARARAKQVVHRSRERYARRREEVEAALRRARPSREMPAEAAPEPLEASEVVLAGESPLGDVAAAERVAEAQRESPRKEKPSPRRPPKVAPLGRGGAQHTYLQELIKRWAEAHEWRAVIEKPILDGLGSVDVALEKGNVRVACEVSVSSTPEQELKNVRKCLAAEFGHVAVVSAERKSLRTARAHIIESVEEKDRDRVHFLTPEELFSFLEEREAEARSTEKTVRGYRVKTRFSHVEAEEREVRRKAISKVIVDAVKRLGGKER